MRKTASILLLGLAVCSRPEKEPVPLVFIHGIKGAELRNAEGSLVWLGARHVIRSQKGELALPYEWKGEEQKRDGVQASGVLKSVYVIPWIAGEEVYGPFLKQAAKMDRPFYPFSYDWRRDNNETVDLFRKFLREVRDRHNKPVQVVAHSMGGLITRAALAEEPELFSSVVFVGVPFNGGLSFLEDMHAGASVGRNARILSPEVYFTLPAAYTLFQEGPSRIFENGKEIELDFYNADDWVKNRLGLYSLELVGPSQTAHLRMALKRGKDFRARVKRPVAAAVPITVVLGKNTPTLAAVEKNGPKSVRGYDFETRPREAGDGRVLEKDALPSGLKHTVFYSEAEHSQQLNEEKVIQLVRELGEKSP